MCVTISSIRTADEFDDVQFNPELLELSGDYVTHRKYFDTAIFIINYYNSHEESLGDDDMLMSLFEVHSFINDLDKTILVKYVDNLIIFD